MKLKAFLLISFSILCSLAKSQTSKSFDDFLNNVKHYNKTYPSEKIHLHFDKPYYALGDTIWFKAYVVNGLNNIPSDYSRILHVDLINSKDSICKSLQLATDFGFASGDFTLTDSTMSAGNYHIKAYTNWMRNFDVEYFFNKSIMVVDPFPTKDNLSATGNGVKQSNTYINSSNFDLQFFPESGNLVNGIKSTVGFKAVSANGYGINIKGKLVDQQNNVILEFETSHIGIGSFAFTPEKGKSYIAVIQQPGNDTKNVPLPKALNMGYVVTADISNPDSLTITMMASPELVAKEEMVLMPTANGDPLFFYKTNFPDKRINITAPRNKLPGGILQFTLFNSKNEPIAERLVFNNYQKVAFTSPDLKEHYKQREKTEVSLVAVDAEGSPIVGSFSMSVVNTDLVTEDEQNATTIFSNLLLTSNLKGYIEKPNYYFIKPSAEKNKELDNLLLTQGYRRFIWEDLANGKNIQLKFEPEDNVYIKGSVSRNNKTHAIGTQVTLFPIQSGLGHIRDTITNSQGHFQFRLENYKASSRFIIQAKEKGLQILTVKLDNYNADNHTIKSNYQYWDTVALNNYAKLTSLNLDSQRFKSGKTHYLKEVVVKDYNPRKKLINSHSDNLMGPGNADYVLNSKDLGNCPDLRCLLSMLPGIIMDNNGNIRLTSNAGTHTGNVLILVDGQEGWNILDINPNDVESVEFLKTVAYTNIYGLRGSGGVLVITIKRGSDDLSVSSSDVKNRKYLTLPIYMAREFYSPKYGNPTAASPKRDSRTTVFWKSEIITDKFGKAKVEFYNNDIPGNYQIVLEGISTKGILARQVFNYKVDL